MLNLLNKNHPKFGWFSTVTNLLFSHPLVGFLQNLCTNSAQQSHAMDDINAQGATFSEPRKGIANYLVFCPALATSKTRSTTHVFAPRVWKKAKEQTKSLPLFCVDYSLYLPIYTTAIQQVVLLVTQAILGTWHYSFLQQSLRNLGSHFGRAVTIGD